MKKILVVIATICLTTALTAQDSDRSNQQLQTEANKIVETLQLEKAKGKLVYNVLYHFKTRLEDLSLGTPNYEKLLGYINEERTEMMKVIMPTNKYNEYDKLYSPVENARIQKLKAINEDYVQGGTEAIMQKDRLLAEAYQ
ncbi:MAG: hypothetical protein LBL90_06190 [Prevotellaceae bacterium]|jgi:hypothetical protein|nr:hypothetical protein [Prevotellaceae bacterium]